MDLTELGAAQLVQMMAKGELTSVELVEACFARIDACEEAVQAWIHLDREFVRKQAEHCDRVHASGTPCGPLHGVPIGIKDTFDTAAYPTENGTVLDAGRRPTEDAAVINRLKAAGAVIMGKTVTTEMAVFSPGKTRNPHDETRTPGGSSSGSAAAVATGMVPLAVGTQTNGSIIRPASFCGVIGFKPSHGRISRDGILPLSRILDQVGVFGRTVEDVAILAESLIGYDPNDPDTRPAPAPQFAQIAAQEPPMPPRYAFIKTPVWDQAESDCQEAFIELSDFLGDQCDEIIMPPEFDHAVSNLRKIMYADLARYLSAYATRGWDQISEVLRGMIEEGRGVSAVDYNNCAAEIQPLRNWVTGLCQEYDAIITPSTKGEAPVGLETTGDPVFCSIWSYLGTPAISLPLMQGGNGMPLGVQVVGQYGDDARLLRSARCLAAQVAKAE